MIVNKRHLLLGLATLALATLAAVGVGLRLAGAFGGDVYPVSVTFGRAGQLLKVTSDVKLRGVLVGKVERIELTDDGDARITLAMQGDQPVPANVAASVRGKTLFGEKFVNLQVEDPSRQRLAAGDVIEEAVDPFELEQVLQAGLPVLEAIEPEQLGNVFGALAEGFAGQEEEARRSIDNGLIALQSLNASSADLDRALAGFDDGAAAFADAAPDLISALEAFDAFNRTVLENRAEASAALRDVPRWMDSLSQIMETRFVDLLDLSVLGADVLDVVAAHSDDLPSTIASLNKFTQDWVTNMSVGCRDVSGRTIDQVHPELAGSTCWQVWNLSAENPKFPGGYSGATRPTPDSASAAAAFKAQVTQLQALPFGTDADDLTLLLYSPFRDRYGVLPEEMR
jgi:phospholipid/cholesterol/gamma-HCH transport system substrate-binding protein